MKQWLVIILVAVSTLVATATTAHTTLVYTGEMAVDRAQDIHADIVFTHAVTGGPTMPLAMPEEFYVASGRMGSKTDLKVYLNEVAWQAEEGTVSAYQADIPRNLLRSLGDHQLVVQTQPYFDANDQLYVQQFVKTIVNVGGAQNGWYSTLGLPAEIQALNTPYANWVGGVFSGVVLSEGLPVPYAQLEIDFINFEPDSSARAFSPDATIDIPHTSYQYVSILSDDMGRFTFGIPHAGWWAISALGVGPETSYEGEYLSQDAILWIQAKDITSSTERD